MRLKNKTKLYSSLIAGFIVGVAVIGTLGFFVVPTTEAQVNIDSNLGATFGLGTADLMSTVINVVQWALGFLGLIAVIMIIYGGYIWTTAGGNPEKVDKAKKIIIRAAVGLIIVLSAWAIVTFIIDRTSTLTGGGGAACSLGPPAETNGCYLCVDLGSGPEWQYQTAWPGCSLGADTFRVTYRSPDGPGAYVCQIVEAGFNGKVLEASIAGNATVYEDATNIPISGTWGLAANPAYIEFLPDSNFNTNTWYRVELLAGIQEDDPSPRAFTGETWWFETGTVNLTNPPTVVNINPTDGQTGVCLNSLIQAEFSQQMRVASFNNSTVLFNDTTAGSPATLSPFSPSGGGTIFSTRPAAPMTAGNAHSVELLAGITDKTDPVYREATNAVMDVCLNHLDGNASGVEEGSATDNYIAPANPAAPWDFVADTDVTNTQCLPEINTVSPDGSYANASPAITVTGANFGLLASELKFNNEVLTNFTCFDGVEFPTIGCITSWNDTTITTHVPGGPQEFAGNVPSAGAMDGNISVSVSPGICVGGTNATLACNFPTDCPGGVCATDSNAAPTNVTSPQTHVVSGRNNQPHGGDGQVISLVKRAGADDGFGATTNTAYFVNPVTGARMPATLAACSTNWTDNYILLQVTDLSSIGITPCDTSLYTWDACPAAHQVSVQVFRGGGPIDPSNLVRFIYTDEEPGPTLCEITPLTCGSNGDTRTLEGIGFGNTPGNADITLAPNPPQALAVAGWNGTATPNTAQVTLPNLDNDPGYLMTLIDNNSVTSNGLPFTVPCGNAPQVDQNASCSNHCVLNPGIMCPTGTECPPGDSCVTGMASPNPYINMADVCRNVNIAARFTMPIDGGMNLTNIQLYRCDDNTAACTAQTQVFAGAGTLNNPTPDVFIWTLPAQLDPDQYYRAFISKELSSAGVKMNNDYAWVFQTKVDPAPCPLEGVNVLPGYTVINTIGNTQGYAATVTGPNCTLLNANDYTWGWSSTDPAVASVAGSTSPLEVATANATGTVTISATAEGETGNATLKVDPESCAFDPTRCADPDLDGTNECPGSVCDLVNDRCIPVIADQDGDLQHISPTNGPNGQYISVEGCYFGTTPGAVDFGGAATGTLDCSNAWSNNLIVVTEPGLAAGAYNLDVQTTAGYSTLVDSSQAGPAYEFTVNGLCGGTCSGGLDDRKPCANNAQCDSGSCVNVPPPAGGPPGICPPLNPAAGRENSAVNIGGANFAPATLNPALTQIYYHEGLQDTYNDVIGRSGVWSTDLITNSRVPLSAETGPVAVQVNNCPSNAVTFGIACNSNSECLSTGCCDLFTNQCTDAINCATSGVGELCQVPSNPNCALPGPGSPGVDYTCISNTGDTEASAPPPPEPPPFGDDCRFCCTPGQVNGSGLICAEDVGVCDGTGRGLYCGCTSDAQCGGGTACGNDTCCHPRPSALSVGPINKMCKNAALEMQFSQAMDQSTLVLGPDATSPQPGESVFVTDSTNGVPLTGRIVTNPTGFHFYPDVPYEAGVNLRVDLHRDRIESTLGIPMWDAPGTMTFTFTTDANAEICQIDHIRFEWWQNGAGPQYLPPPAVYHCSTDNCEIELGYSPPHRDALIGFSPTSDGNQRFVRAYPESAEDNILSGNIDIYWDDVVADPLGVFSATHQSGAPWGPCAASPQLGGNHFACMLTSDNVSGTGYLQVRADGSSSTFGDVGDVTEYMQIRSGLCSNPWPSPHAPVFDELPFRDTVASPKPDTITSANAFTTNFSTWYCGDDGLPILKQASDVVVKEGTSFSPGSDDLIKEYFFLRDSTDDAIGIRVMENEQFLSPTQWYRQQFGPAAPEPQTLTVDGYPAVRAGRTVYVAATNLTGGTLYPNIYLISYNEDASSESIEIYNRLIQNWEFNEGMSPVSKGEIQRDMKRLNDLSDIASRARTYQSANSTYPILGGGTFVGNMSMSRWPSWQETFASELGGSLPIDPLNEFVPTGALCLEANGFDTATCWDDGDKVYECPDDSHTYQYLSTASGDAAWLYTRLEYEGVGNWLQPPVGDPCNTISNAACDCYNYEYGITGTTTDRQGPVINSVDSLGTSGTTTISGTRAMITDVVDAISGVDRVEYFVDGIRQFTDSDGSDGWNYDFDTTSFGDGQYTFSVAAFDTVGNRTQEYYEIFIDNSSGPDTIAPFISVINPLSGDELSGVLNYTMSVSDNRGVLGARIDTVQGANSWNHTTFAPGGVTSITLTHPNNPTTFPGIVDGPAQVVFTADDGVNTTVETIDVTIKIVDSVAPTVSILTPAPAATVSDTIDVTALAMDDIAIDRVDYYIDGQFRGTESVPGNPNEYTYRWDTKAFANGDHTVQVYAYDTYGNFSSAGPITVTADNVENDVIPPVVTFIDPTPADGTGIDGVVFIRVDATDDHEVDRVHFYVDYLRRFTDYTGEPSPPQYWEWQLDTTVLSDGWHTIQVDAIDIAGNRSTSIEIRVNVRGVGGPLISSAFIDPASGPPGTVFCNQADVSSVSGVARVDAVIEHPDEVIVDRVPLFLSGGSTFRGDWDSTGFPNEAYLVDIEAEGNDGLVSNYNNIPGNPGGCPVGLAPVITSSLNVTTEEDSSFSYSITATNGPTSYNAVGMPAWLSRTSNVLSGTPPIGAAGSYSMNISATNSTGTDTRTLTITVDPAGTTPTWCDCGYTGPSCSGYTNPTSCNSVSGCNWSVSTLSCQRYNCSAYSGPSSNSCEARTHCSCDTIP